MKQEQQIGECPFLLDKQEPKGKCTEERMKEFKEELNRKGILNGG